MIGLSMGGQTEWLILDSRLHKLKIYLLNPTKPPPCTPACQINNANGPLHSTHIMIHVIVGKF